MKIIRVLEGSRLVLFLLPLLLASFIPPALATPSYAPNVVKGDYWNLGDWSISCSTFCPSGPGSPLGISSLRIEVLNVTGYNVGLNQTFTNEYGQSSSMPTIANTQSASSFTLIAGNLVKGDPISNATFAPTINATITRFYAGANRQVNVLNIGQPQTGGAFVLYWDQITGALLEIKESIIQQGSGTIAVQAKITSTNLWPSTLPDFTFSSTGPSPPSINVGSSSMSTITLTSLNGLSGSVQLSAFVAPSFVSPPIPNIANPTITLGPTGQTTLTITTTSSTTPGLYTVQVFANYTNTISHYTTLTVTVTGPDFSIAAVPSSLFIPSGGTDVSMIVVRSIQGFTGIVTLSPTPGALQLSLNPTSVNLSGGSGANSTLTITVPNFIPAGYPELFQVTGTSGPLVHQVQGSVNVTAAAPPPDINITASPSTLNLSPGTVGISTITVTSVRGFTGTVDLHSYIYSDGVGLFGVLNVTSVTLTPGKTSAHAVLAIPYPGTGGVRISVQASGPRVGRAVNLTVTGTPLGPDFSVNASQTGFLVAPGSTFTSTLTLASFNGYADTIHIVQLPYTPGSTSTSQQPYPTGCTPTISSGGNPVQLHAGGSNTTTIGFTVPGCAPQGSQNILLTLTGTRVPTYHTYFFGYTVQGNSTSTLPDFTLTQASKSPISFPQGSVANVTVAVSSVNGFSGTVTLTGDLYYQVILPESVSLGPGGTADVTIQQVIPSNQPVGCCVSASLIGTSGAISHTLTANVNVTAGIPASFTVTGSSYFVNLIAGRPNIQTLTVKSLNNFSGTIDLTSIFDPQQLAVSFNQTGITISPAKTAFIQMTINNATAVSVGNWGLSVLARSGSSTAATTFQVDLTSSTAPDFTVTISPPGILNLKGAFIGSVNLEVKSTNGFTGNVQFEQSLSNYLSTVLFSSNQVFLPPGANVNVTMYVTPAYFNPYTNNYVQFSAVSGTIVQQGTLQVNATSLPDFGMFGSEQFNAPVSFSAGGSTSLPISLFSEGGFTSPISLGASSYPAGLNFHFNATTVTPRPITGLAAANLTISGPVPGSYIVVISATSGVPVRIQILVVNVTTVPDFNMTATPPSLNIPAGSTSTTKITVKSLNGFAGKVSLNAYALNFQLSLSAPSVTLTAGGNANVTLTIPVPINAPTGLYQFGVSGNTTTYSTSLTIPVTVIAELHSFNVTANPTLLTFLVGAQATSTITVTANNGFTGTVNLGNNTATPLATCSLSPTSITLSSTTTSGTSTLTCTASAPGTYNVTIKGDSGTERHATTVTLFVPRIAYVPGLTVGQTVTFHVADLTWTSTIPKQLLPEPSIFILLNDTAHIDLRVNRVSGSNVTIQLTWYFNNGTAPTTGFYSIDVVTGAYNSTGVVPISFTNSILATGLQVSDHVYETPYSPTINMTTTRTLLGTVRTVNFLNMTMTSPNTISTVGFMTDQMSGMFVGADAQFKINGGTLGTAEATLALRLNSTNIWTTSSKPSVTITNITPNPANTGQQVTVHFTVSSPTAVSGITVNWGDGTTTDILPGTAISDTHIYASTGTQTHSTFNINVTATNSAGSGSGTTTEIANDQPPTVTVSSVSPNPANNGQPVTVAFSATDPDGTIQSFSVNWGDGHTDTGVAGTATSDTHSYIYAGTFTITVTATDDSGSTGSDAKPITVNLVVTTATLSVSCSPNSILASTSTSCTVNVTGSSLYVPTGIVSLSTNSTSGAFTPSTGKCTLYYGTCSVAYTDTATSNMTAQISASYPGDTYNTGASSSVKLKVVKPAVAPTTATAAASCSPSTVQVGAFTTCTVTVTGSTPTGSVTLTTTSGTGYFTPSNGQCTLASGSCAVTYTDTATASVTARIYARYAGDTYNTVAYTNTTLTIMKPSTTTATATSTVTISSGSATADQTATTGVSVQITGSTATDGTPAAINTQDLSSASSGVGTVSLSGAKFYDVVVTGVTSGNAKVCINYASASSSTTMQYWSGTAWTSATGITVNGGTVCGQIPVSALTGTNIAIGNTIQPAPSQPLSNSNLLLIIAIVVAVVVIAAVAAVSLKRRGKISQTSQAMRQ